jgi:ABC-type sugar transport system substrate-binding protein
VRRLKRLLVFAVLAAVAVGVAACGSSSSSSSTSSAAAAGTGTSSSAAAATGGSGTTAPGSHTIGVIPSTSSSENLAVWMAQLKAAASVFGWKVTICNGNGVVSTMESCAQSLVTQKVSAIVTMALGGPEIPQGFKQAKAAGIPVIAEGTSVYPQFTHTFSAVFGDDIVKAGQITADYIAKNLKNQPVTGLEITANYGGQGYVNGVKAGLATHGMKYDDLRDTNLADIVNSMTTTAQNIATAHSGPITFVTFNDIDASLDEPEFTRAGRNKNITMITRYDDPSTVKLMRTGDNILINNTKDWQHIFDMLTALAAHWTKGAPLPPPSQTVNNPGGGVYSIKAFQPGATRQYPFDPALKAQEKIWAKTYKLQSTTATAP